VRPRWASGAPVSGDVFLPRENQSSILLRSYVLPSAAITGHSISSIDIGQHRLSGWSPPEVAAVVPPLAADAEAAATILLASSAGTPTPCRFRPPRPVPALRPRGDGAAVGCGLTGLVAHANVKYHGH